MMVRLYRIKGAFSTAPAVLFLPEDAEPRDFPEDQEVKFGVIRRDSDAKLWHQRLIELNHNKMKETNVNLNTLKLFIGVAFVSTITYGYGVDLTVEDIVNISESNFGKIRDIEFISKVKYSSENIDTTERILTSIWHAESKWEKQIWVTPYETNGPAEHVSVLSWDGDVFKSTTENLSRDGTTIRKEGAIAKSRPLLQEDILTVLCIKGGVADYKYYLTRPNVVIEGSTQVDGQDVLILNIDLQETPKGKESYLYLKLYVDINRGAVPLKKELYANMKLVNTVKDVVVSEIEEGIFLPVKAGVYIGPKADVVNRQLFVDVKSIRLNQGLKKEYFGLEFEHNLPVWDTRIDMGYYQGVGIAPEENVDQIAFDEAIEKVKHEHAVVSEAPINKPFSKSKKGNLAWIIIAIVILSLILVVFFVTCLRRGELKKKL